MLTPKIGFIQSWGKHEQRAEFAQGVKTIAKHKMSLLNLPTQA
ncbi:MAG: hypothetical protein ACLR5Y_04290 [Haemophilus parainfluenzae]